MICSSKLPTATASDRTPLKLTWLSVHPWACTFLVSSVVNRLRCHHAVVSQFYDTLSPLTRNLPLCARADLTLSWLSVRPTRSDWLRWWSPFTDKWIEKIIKQMKWYNKNNCSLQHLELWDGPLNVRLASTGLSTIVCIAGGKASQVRVAAANISQFMRRLFIERYSILFFRFDC